MPVEPELLRERLRNLIDGFDPEFTDADLVGYAEALFDAAGHILTHEYNNEG